MLTDENQVAATENSAENEKTWTDAKPLTQELIGQGIGLIAKTGDGLGYAYTQLNLTAKDITNIDILSQYVHLRYLNLFDNEIKDLKPLVSMDYLLSLDMGKNKISDISSHLDKKLFLQQLNFDYNQLEQFNLTQLPILAWLNLSHNQLTEVQLADFPCLTHFEARANKITQITKLNAPKLQKLYLAQNKIKALNELGDKKQLQVLHLRDNEIESLDGLSDQMKELRYLNLRNNRIQSMDEIDKLKVLPALKELVLMGNPLDHISSYRSEIIHRLPQVENLDKLAVTKEDREQAEQYFVELEAERQRKLLEEEAMKLQEQKEEENKEEEVEAAPEPQTE